MLSLKGSTGVIQRLGYFPPKFGIPQKQLHFVARNLSKRSPKTPIIFKAMKKLKKSKKLNIFLLYELFTVNFFPGKSCRKSVRSYVGAVQQISVRK